MMSFRSCAIEVTPQNRAASFGFYGILIPAPARAGAGIRMEPGYLVVQPLYWATLLRVMSSAGIRKVSFSGFLPCITS